jgi:hypothetical protein
MFKVSDLLFGAVPWPPTLSSGVVVLTVAVLSSVRAASAGLPVRPHDDGDRARGTAGHGGGP